MRSKALFSVVFPCWTVLIGGLLLTSPAFAAEEDNDGICLETPAPGEWRACYSYDPPQFDNFCTLMVPNRCFGHTYGGGGWTASGGSMCYAVVHCPFQEEV
jgi:hypothetical protein